MEIKSGLGMNVEKKGNPSVAINALENLGRRSRQIPGLATNVMEIFNNRETKREVRVAAVKAVVGMQIEEVKYVGVKSRLIMFLRDRLQDKDARIRTIALDVISISLGNAAIRYDKFFSRHFTMKIRKCEELA